MSNDSTDSEKPDRLRSSPTSGCFILSTIILIFGGLIVLYTVVGTYQNRKIDEFTSDAPITIPVIEAISAEIETASAKLKMIGTAVKNETPERIEFSADKLNILIATREELKDFREQTYIERISPQGIVARMSQPMRSGLSKKNHRYLNGTFVFQPELRARTVAFKVLDIRPDKGDAPQAFIESYATLDFFRLDPDLEAIQKNIKSIAAVYTEPGKLIVETKIPQPEPTE